MSLNYPSSLCHLFSLGTFLFCNSGEFLPSRNFISEENDAYLEEFYNIWCLSPRVYTTHILQNMDYTSSFFLYDILLNDTSQQLAFPIYAAQIKVAVLNGISLEDEKRDQFNKIEQVSFSNLLCIQPRFILWCIASSYFCGKKFRQLYIV